MQQSIARLDDWLRAPAAHCRYVVTPNVDHLVMLKYDRAFQRAYRQAALVVPDGWPVTWAARLLGKPLAGLVPGSDLTPALMGCWRGPQPLRVFLLGAMPGVGARAAENIHRRWSKVRVVGVDSPPLGFEYDEKQCQRLIRKVADAAPDLLVMGVGAPKQELWVCRHRRQLRAKVALCVGATIDFLAGEKPRAPQWMRNAGLEWLHRIAQEPRRLLRRYLHDACEFPRIVWDEWRGGAGVGAPSAEPRR